MVGAESKNMQLLAHNDLNGQGNGGEGMALQQTADGRRILYIAHERAPTFLSIVEVSDPHHPQMVGQLTNEDAVGAIEAWLQSQGGKSLQKRPLPFEINFRSNSLALVGNTLFVAIQNALGRSGITQGKVPAGLTIYDVTQPEVPRLLSFFDTSGPASPGVHFVWCVDGQFAHISTGAADFIPAHPADNQFYMIVDVRDPRRPTEVGRWWLPGQRAGEAATLARVPGSAVNAFRLHNALVMPQRPDRAYLGYIDGGVVILDITDKTQPQVVGRCSWYPPFTGFSHTVLPLFERGLAVVSEESTQDFAADFPKLIWLLDIHNEANPVTIGTAPLPENVNELCGRGGWFGAHNIHENMPLPTSAVLRDTIVGSFFNGGVRGYRFRDPLKSGAPPTLEEAGFFIPPPPAGSPKGVIQINDVYVDEQKRIYAVDRYTGGLYILQFTGSPPLS
jgi:hypothetical protein